MNELSITFFLLCTDLLMAKKMWHNYGKSIYKEMHVSLKPKYLFQDKIFFKECFTWIYLYICTNGYDESYGISNIFLYQIDNYLMPH